MNRILLFLLPAVLSGLPGTAQNLPASDTLYHVDLRNHDVGSTRLWANDTAQYRYNQMKYYVKTVLPFLDAATELFRDLDKVRRDPAMSPGDRRAYARRKEAAARAAYESRVRLLNETQGVLLIKLTARQTGFNIYDQVAGIKGTLPALKWQAWAKLHGFSLNRKYHPEEEQDLERIMRSLGYPLPACYGGVGDGY